MKRRIGFSTGALALGDFRKGVDLMLRHEVEAIELSALRDHELEPLLASLAGLPLQRFKYISFHAPSGLQQHSEADVVSRLKELLPRGWPIIVHPDMMSRLDLWEALGEALCIENMDKRKPIGRTVTELQPFFDRFPAASFCFDIGHARQVDPTMTEAALLLRRFGSRLKQIHMSEVNTRSRHEPISFTALAAFQEVAHLLADVPIILETVIPEGQIERQMRLAESVFARAAVAS